MNAKPDSAPIDFRSDTLTLPTDAMRQAIAAAVMGDDVFGEDPTTRELEELTASLTGKEAALLMVSGTMSNQVAIRAQTEPGDELIADADSHIIYYEGGGPAALSGVMCRGIAGDRGVFNAQQLQSVLRPPNIHHPRTRLVCLENTHNRGGGRVWPWAIQREVIDVARQNGLRLHLDGARIWNASRAAGRSVRELCDGFDSVSVCFSKGLGAPAGSALAGSRDLIERARRVRKMFGGGLRQAGLVAAGALHALRNHVERLEMDHAHAKRLARALAELPGLRLKPDEVETNIVILQVAPGTAKATVARMDAAGVRTLPVSDASIRFVTHLHHTTDHIDHAIEVLRKALA